MSATINYMSGILCDVYHPSHAKAKYEKVLLVGEGVPKVVKLSDGTPVVRLHREIIFDRPHFKAVPLNGEHHSFSGCFLYSNDDRFPADFPIKLYDAE